MHRDKFGQIVAIGDTIVFASSYNGSTDLTRGVITGFTRSGNPRVTSTRYVQPYIRDVNGLVTEEYDKAIVKPFVYYGS